jgi:hypothetical protein
VVRTTFLQFTVQINLATIVTAINAPLPMFGLLFSLLFTVISQRYRFAYIQENILFFYIFTPLVYYFTRLTCIDLSFVSTDIS